MVTLSVVVVVHDMARELPRTLASMGPDRQRGLDADAYEIIVVDNGSDPPVDARLTESFDGNLRLERLDPAPASPARAANHGIGLAAATSWGSSSTAPGSCHPVSSTAPGERRGAPSDRS